MWINQGLFPKIQPYMCWGCAIPTQVIAHKSVHMYLLDNQINLVCLVYHPFITAGFMSLLCGLHWVACDWTRYPLEKEPCRSGLLWWNWDPVCRLPFPQGPGATSRTKVLLLLCRLWAADLCWWQGQCEVRCPIVIIMRPITSSLIYTMQDLGEYNIMWESKHLNSIVGYNMNEHIASPYDYHNVSHITHS